MTIQDEVIGALVCWRENRGGGAPGMQSIFNVLQNRAIKRATSVYEEATRRLQFSSMTAPGDSQLVLYPTAMDSQWAVALTIATQASQGLLEDITSGANLYYNPNGISSDLTITLPTGETIKWPKGWDQSKVTYLSKIANHYFFRE